MKKLLFILLIGCAGEAILLSETGAVFAFFCDKEDCFELLKNWTGSGEINCAFYHVSNEQGDYLLNNGGLVVDEEHPLRGAVIEAGSGLMHNKFCVINRTFVWTGSWNPSQGKSMPNNVVLVESRVLAKAYLDEFEELKSGVFHGGKPSGARVALNGALAETFFCPEDKCQEKVIEILNSAKSSIHFMAFSFTDDKIGALLERKAGEGVDVRGVFDPRMDKYSEYSRLKNQSVVSKVHHKVFVIDGRTVITGSANPTGNGYKRNDENILILRDERIAAVFEEEFVLLTLSIRASSKAS